MLLKMENTGTNGWEDGDVDPTLTYVGHKEWSDSPASDEFAYDASRLQLIEPKTVPEYPDQTTTFSEANRNLAMSMTILPMYVRYDHQLLPEENFTMIVDDSNDYGDMIPDSSHSSWTETLASDPISGGDWFHHIVIAHRAKGGASVITTVIR